MIAKLRKTLAERGITNIEPMQADLTRFHLPEQVDVVFSNAVFHWIQDDDGLFGSLARATKSGGRLRAQCGGGDNIRKLMAATRDVEKREPYSAAPQPAAPSRESTARNAQAVEALERNGWKNARADVFPSDVVFEDERRRRPLPADDHPPAAGLRLPDDLATRSCATSSPKSSAPRRALRRRLRAPRPLGGAYVAMKRREFLA